MKITILQEELIKGLSVVSRVVTSRGQMPILANVLIEADSGGVTISATNLDLAMRIGIGGKVEEVGAVTVPAKTLTEFVGTLPAGVVALENVEDKLKVEIGKYKADFAGIGAAEFPEIARFNKKDGVVTLNKKMFLEAATKVAFSAATDESRPVLTGVKFQITNNKLQITATDGFRLSRETLDVEGELGTLIIPARSVLELAKILGEGKKEEVEIQTVASNNQVVFSFDKFQVVSRLLEGNFPDVDKIIPTEFKTTTIVDRQELIRGVRAAGIFAREANNIIKLQIANDKLQIKVVGGQTGGSEVEVEVESVGEETEISFNFRYVLDYLNSVEFEQVRLMTNGPLEKGVWRGENNETHTHLIMPVRV